LNGEIVSLAAVGIVRQAAKKALAGLLHIVVLVEEGEHGVVIFVGQTIRS
jgi:hypothetical protein